MKNKLIKGLITCLTIGIVVLGGYYGYNKFFTSKAAATANQYITVTAKKTNMQVNIQGTGSAYAATSKDISPNNNGILKDLNVKVGDTVKAGTKLFTSDSDDLRQNITKAQNSLDKAKLTLANSKNDNETAMNNLSVSDAQNQLNSTWQQVNNMTVKAPVSGVITAVNNSNGDSVQSGKSIVSIVDPSSMKIKVAVDELDIAKVKEGQKAEVKFDAIKDKIYDGTVESIAQLGTSTNNVTTYDVVVAIANPTDIKIGMNANVNILVDSKDDALTIPSEALIDRNGNKYVMIQNSESNSSNSNTGNSSSDKRNAYQNNQNTSTQNGQSIGGNSQGSRNGGNMQGYAGGTSTGTGKLVQVKTGLENENYVEIVEGITENQKVLINLPVSTSTTNTNNRNSLGGGLGGGNFGAGFGGGNGGTRQQGGGNRN
ncbi:hemolysin D [Clostridium polyendosporum]|uniref:Hemolysin D n=1 Tax=Clostridium polyendosporum TaxID=69208 RepID=A0A919RVP7_9CLOT|nr:efflux RND transporter periplasmic adaptor subunit [Clostridium polyendosporum]GIM27357.1 hemolysin D [Clostridium polyendosporum]